MPRTRWLSSKVRRLFPKCALVLGSPYCQGYEFREAVDGREGVHVYETDGQFEYVSPGCPSAIYSLYQCHPTRFINASIGW